MSKTIEELKKSLSDCESRMKDRKKSTTGSKPVVDFGHVVDNVTKMAFEHASSSDCHKKQSKKEEAEKVSVDAVFDKKGKRIL